MNFGKMFIKIGQNALKTAAVGLGAGGAVFGATGGQFTPESIATALGTAIGTSIITGLTNWWKHRNDPKAV